MKMEEKEKWTSCYSQHPSLRKLTPVEKKYLLAVEHGDIDTVIRILHVKEKQSNLPLDVNCMDPVGRTATLMTIDNENLEMLQMLLENGVLSKDSLLHAINAEYVEAVDLLLEHEETIHKEGDPHSWERVDRDISTFTPEISPLILAAHKDNYEILKLLLDRGATLPMPHDVRCKCNDCVRAIEEDCLFHSRSRINAYRALSSPSLICLSSIDPILTAFELSWELRRLSFVENEFKNDYQKLRFLCQDFATALLDHARSSRELEVILNHDPARLPYQHGDHMPLTRVEMAIKYKQKKFIAHPNVQQLLTTLWYDGLPGFRKQNAFWQLWDIVKIGVLFPFYAWMYMLMPKSPTAKLIRKPFFKFILHSFSYLFFLFLLILASQRVETLVVQLFGTERMKLELMESMKIQRGQLPSIIESSILLYIIAHIWQETRDLWKKGLFVYFQNMWNIIDFVRNSLYVGTAGLRVLAYFQAQAEIRANPMAAYIPRESWDPFDPTLIADGLFAAGNVFAALKLIHMFSINPHLGPLQISLGRMVIDIIKFFFIYTLVLFAFACGLNQLLWYYAELEKQECYSGSGGTENWEQERDSCLAWRRFSNLFESSQSLFWASFGLIDISNFELTGIKSYTRFWGLLMFGSYSVINVVVLLNLLIAMMSNSYQMISERSDVEWKFARTALFMNYFEEGDTVPPPFNIFPTVKILMRMLKKKKPVRDASIKRKESKMKERDSVYQSVMCNLVWRYVTAQQKACEENAVTEDHVNELRQDVSAFRHELMGVLRSNGMNTSEVELDKIEVSGKKIQVRKRRLIKDFSIGLMEVCTDDAAPEVKGNKGSMLARLGLSSSEGASVQRWRDLIQAVKKSNMKNKESVLNGKHHLQKQSSIEEIETTDEQLTPDNIEGTQSPTTKTFAESHREMGEKIRDKYNAPSLQNSTQRSNYQTSHSPVIHQPSSPSSDNAVANDYSTPLPENASEDSAIGSPMSDGDMEKANILPEFHQSDVCEDILGSDISPTTLSAEENSSSSTTSNRENDTHSLKSYCLEKKQPESHSPFSSRSLQKFCLDDARVNDGAHSKEDSSKTPDVTSLGVNEEKGATDHTVTMVLKPLIDQCLDINELPQLSQPDHTENVPSGETTINVPSSAETSPVRICPTVATPGSAEITHDKSQSENQEDLYTHIPDASNHESVHPSISITVVESVEDEITENIQSDIVVTATDHVETFSCTASVLNPSDSTSPVSPNLIVMQMPRPNPEAQFRFTDSDFSTTGEEQEEDTTDTSVDVNADALLPNSDQQLLLCEPKFEGITVQRHRKGWI